MEFNLLLFVLSISLDPPPGRLTRAARGVGVVQKKGGPNGKSR